MGSDRARVSYDPSRKWRGLVAQQGRVTVEADWNEAAAIEAAGDRAVTLDVVGPVGTPDDGYAVTTTRPSSPPASSPPAATEGDLSVGPGTLYLGGERLDLATPVELSNQPDWRDPATGTLWVAPPPPPDSPPSAAGNELVYLLAIEQEVSALEDPALADVALGGPDTMQRLRVLQRFVRWPTQASSCSQAWTDVQVGWAAVGLTVDPASKRLESTARLQVGFVTDPAPASPCQPVATGGYLGAENQLIRVQIASVDADGVPTIVWGFDDATFLYELSSVIPDSGGHLVLSLAKAPVDNYHNPVSGQAVELLRDAASLTPDNPGSAADGHYIAAAAGPVFTLTQGYDSSSGTVAVAGTLPAGYQDADQLYLRVWQASMPAPAGTPVTLTGAGATTGVTVTLSSAGGRFHPGDYWCFALRPSVPNLIYPARYAADPQAPDGARVLACPVALVDWSEQGAPAVSSCIPPFDNLVELTARGGDGCCTLTIAPDDPATTTLDAGSNTLQEAVTMLQTVGGTICLSAGTYTLDRPVTMTGCRSIRIRGEGAATVLRAPNGAFAVNNSIDCTVEDLVIVSDKFGVPSAAIALNATLGTTLQRLKIVALRPRDPTSPPTGTAVTLDGIQSALTIRENSIMAAFGVTLLPAGTGLLAVGMRIQSNALLCSFAAIALLTQVAEDATDTSIVAFAYGAELIDNRIATPTPAVVGGGIIAVGPMLAGGNPKDPMLGADNLKIVGNDILVSAAGIVASPSDCIVSSNTIVSIQTQAFPGGEKATPGVAVTIVDGAQVRLSGDVRIDDNTIRGMGHAINIGFTLDTENTPVPETVVTTGLVSISRNTIHNCINGILVQVSGDVSITDNFLDLSTAFTQNVDAYAISAVSRNLLSITGNTIDEMFVPNGAAIGIMAPAIPSGTAAIKISDNTISELVAPRAKGIVVEAAATLTDIAYNRVTLGATNTSALTVTPEPIGPESQPVVNITNNVLASFASQDSIVGAGATDLQFSGNTIQSLQPGGSIVIDMFGQAPTLRCQDNLVREAGIKIDGGQQQDPAAATIIGNVTTNGIGASNVHPPMTQWQPLNVTIS